MVVYLTSNIVKLVVNNIRFECSAKGIIGINQNPR